MKLGIRRTYKMVDTCAAEFETKTPTFTLLSIMKTNQSQVIKRKSSCWVQGQTPDRPRHRFDYCCVHGLMAIKETGYEAIMVNYNPETVSTDFDVADKLYFEQFTGNISKKFWNRWKNPKVSLCN